MNGSSTDDLDQIAVSLGTMVTNKDYTGNVSAVCKDIKITKMIVFCLKKKDPQITLHT